MAENKIYFAYGSNINQRQMKQRCSSAAVIGTGFIEGYELQFKGVATIAAKENAQTPILAYTLGALDEMNLDSYEGYPNVYVKKNFDVEIGGKSYSGMAYTLGKFRPLMKPTDQYAQTIADGYRAAGLDLDYLKKAYDTAKNAELSRQRIYIAYGSNINQQQMAHRCPGATVLNVGEIPDYQLEFRIHANIAPQENGNTPVLIWNISAENEFLLDRYESFPHYYRKEYFEYKQGNQTDVAMAYVMNRGHPIEPPHRSYYNSILEGYKQAGLDVSKLEEALEQSYQVQKKEICFDDENQLRLE